MSKALERVQQALHKDEQRLLKKQLSQAPGAQKKELWDEGRLGLDALESLDLQDIDKKHKYVFQQLVSQILTINRCITSGIKRSELKDWHELSKFRPATSDDHMNFMGQVLSNFQLMAQSSRALRSVHEYILGAEEENFASGKPIDRVKLLNLLAKAVHDTKQCTAHLCWHDFVRPTRERKSEFESGVHRLKAQLRAARETYLKEVSSLRDSARQRKDPSAGHDVVLFYEPLQALEPEEKNFMVDMVIEVLKGLVDVNPEFAQGFNSSQIERLISDAHSKELEALKEKLEQKQAKILEQQEAQRYLESQLQKAAGQGRSFVPDHSVLDKYEKMMRLMEDQLGCLRVDFWNLQQEHQKLQQEQQQVEAERQELVVQLEKETAESRMLQEEVSRLCSVEEEFKETILRLETEKGNLKQSVHELQTRTANLNKALQRQRRSEEKAPEFAGKEQENDLARTSLEAEHELIRERDSALWARDQKAARCAELEKLLRAHASQLPLQPAQQMEEAAEELSKRAECLGCSPRSREKVQVRVCQCGNVLMHDAQFCRKCGGKWMAGPAVSPKVEEAAAEISRLQLRISELEQALREREAQDPEVEVDALSETDPKHRTESAGGMSLGLSNSISMSMSRLLRPITIEDMVVTPEKQQEQLSMMQMRQELDELKKNKLHAEARLLTQRCDELSKEGSSPFALGPVDLDVDEIDAFAPLSPLTGELPEDLAASAALAATECDGVNCRYRRELEAAQEMIRTLRALGGQLSDKLTVATGEHLQMTMALTSMQGSLEAAVQAVERDVQDAERGDEVDLQQTLGKVSMSLQESKRRSVFWRLYQSHGRSATKRGQRLEQGQAKRLELLQKTYEQLYKIDELPKPATPAMPITVSSFGAAEMTPPPPLPSMPHHRQLHETPAERPASQLASARRSTLPAVPDSKTEKPKKASLIQLGSDLPLPLAPAPEVARTWSQRRRRAP